MNSLVFEMIQQGQAAELAAQLANHAQLADAHNADGISALRAAVYHHQPAIRDLLLPFEVTSVLILIAILGAVALARHHDPKDQGKER